MRTPGVSTKKRMVASLIAILVILGGIIIRLGYIQLVQGGDLQAKALDQWTSDLPVTAKRGRHPGPQWPIPGPKRQYRYGASPSKPDQG